MSSAIPGFYKLSPAERVKKIQTAASLSDGEAALLTQTSALPLETADHMIENVAGTFPLPLGFATNFQINKKDVIIPMAIEEPSVVAAASNLAKMTRTHGGFKATSTDPIMIGQIQLVNLPDVEKARAAVLTAEADIKEICNSKDSTLVKFGGGFRGVEARPLKTEAGDMLIVHLLIDCRDAMGANAVNTMAEAVSPKLEELTGGEARLKIISNLATHRLTKAEAIFDKEALGGEESVDRILEAYAFAAADPYRAATHNKGIMNGIDPVVIATGNDWRAVEAGAHAYAAHERQYTSLTHYEKTPEGHLKGSIELPMSVGLVGGATKVHPIAKLAVKILGVKTAAELGQIIVSVGLAQNLAALRALSNEGIQKGHMKLHARNIAATAGATPEQVDAIAQQMIEDGTISVSHAEEILKSG